MATEAPAATAMASAVIRPLALLLRTHVFAPLGVREFRYLVTMPIDWISGIIVAKFGVCSDDFHALPMKTRMVMVSFVTGLPYLWGWDSIAYSPETILLPYLPIVVATGIPELLG